MFQGKVSSIYNKLRGLGKRGKAQAEVLGQTASAVLAEARVTYQESEIRRKLTVVVSQSTSIVQPQLDAVKEEVHIVGIAVYEEASIVLGHINETRIKPFREALGEELREWRSVASEDEGLLADTVRDARDFISGAVGKKKASASPRKKRSSANKPVSMSPRAVWRSLKQAKDLIFDDTRGRQFEEMSGPGDSAARLQLAQTESAVDRYLKVAAMSVGFSTLGMLFLPPLKLVSAGLILYAAFPVFKGAYTDVCYTSPCQRQTAG